MQPLSQVNSEPGGVAPRKRRGLLKWLLAAVLVLLVAAAAGGFYLRQSFSPEKIKAEISALALRHSGYALSIAEVDFTLTGDVRLKRICLRNPKMVSERCFVSANVVSLDLAILPLLKKQIEVRGAHVDAVEVSFFTEKSQTADKKQSPEIGSWQGQATESEAEREKAAEAGAEARFKLKSLRVTNGTIAHEVKVLPLPTGKTTFTAVLAYAPLRQNILAKWVFPDGSRVESELNIKSANLVNFARQLVAAKRIDAAEAIDGHLDCQNCSLSELDSRLKTLNGRLMLQSVGSTLTVKSEEAEIAVHTPIKLTLAWAGEASVDLMTGGLTSGQGKLKQPGLVIEYNNLGSDNKTNAKLTFAVHADLPAIAPQLAPGVGLSGRFSAAGKYENGVVAAQLKFGQLRVARGDLPGLSADNLSGTLSGSQVSFSRQQLALGGQAFEASARISLQGRATTVSGSVEFPVLKLNKLLAAEASQTSDMVFSPLSAQIQTSGSVIRFDKISAGFARGQISGSYIYDYAAEKHTARLGLSRIKTHDLSEALKLKATVFGVLDGRFDATFTGNNRAQVLKTITGSINASIGRGKIKDSFLQKGILNGPLHKLEAKFSDTEFESAAVEAVFSSGALSLKKLNFDAGEFNVNMRAESAAGGQGKATLNFRFRASFVENVANPLHMGIESLRDGDFYDLPFACRGDVFSSACYTKNW